MKIKLALSDERAEEVARFLEQHGIEVDDSDSADLILSETGNYVNHLTVRDGENGERFHIPVDDVVYIASFGHTVEVYTEDRIYTTAERLYQLMYSLDPAQFVRISNSVIIARRKVKEIRPTLSMKFVLLMKNGDRVDVTRSYYHSFKEYFGI